DCDFFRTGGDRRPTNSSPHSIDVGPEAHARGGSMPPRGKEPANRGAVQTEAADAAALRGYSSAKPRCAGAPCTSLLPIGWAAGFPLRRRIAFCTISLNFAYRQGLTPPPSSLTFHPLLGREEGSRQMRSCEG